MRSIKAVLLALGTTATLSGTALAIDDATNRNDPSTDTNTQPMNDARQMNRGAGPSDINRPSDESSRSSADARSLDVRPDKMTCQDFLALEEVQRPKALYWLEGYNQKGKTEDVYSISSTDTLVPILVQDCESTPKASFMSKVRGEFKHNK